MSDYVSLKVPELKKLLAEKKLSQTGNKADLIARLQEADKKDATASTEDGKPGMYIDCAFSFFLFDMGSQLGPIGKRLFVALGIFSMGKATLTLGPAQPRTKRMKSATATTKLPPRRTPQNLKRQRQQRSP